MNLVNEWFLNWKFIKVDTPFRIDSGYENELLAALPLSGHALHKAKVEYHGKFGHTLIRIQHIALISIIDLFNATFCLTTQTEAPNTTGFQGIKRCVSCLDSHPHKHIFYPSNYYDGSNAIRLTWFLNQVEYHTTQICLECHQDAYHTRILNRRRSVLGIIYDLIGVAVWWKL